MAAAIPIVAKIAVGAVVGKIVGKVTGSQLLGAVAGGFAGGGLGLDMASGAVSWSNPLTGLASGAAGTAGEVVAGGTGLAEGGLSGLSGIGGDIAGTSGVLGQSVGGAAGVLGDVATLPSITGGIATGAESVLGGGIPGLSSGGASLMGGGAMSAGGGIGGLLGKAGGFLNKNPALANIGFQGVSAMMRPDAEELMKSQTKEDIKLLREKEAIRKGSERDIDEEAAISDLESVNQRLAQQGYRPQSEVLREGGYKPMYIDRVSANRKRQLESVYNPEEK